jgi:hypothetical protein
MMLCKHLQKHLQKRVSTTVIAHYLSSVSLCFVTPLLFHFSVSSSLSFVTPPPLSSVSISLCFCNPPPLSLLPFQVPCHDSFSPIGIPNVNPTLCLIQAHPQVGMCVPYHCICTSTYIHGVIYRRRVQKVPIHSHFGRMTVCMRLRYKYGTVCNTV